MTTAQTVDRVDAARRAVIGVLVLVAWGVGTGTGGLLHRAFLP